MRINKYLAASGIASRREADRLIVAKRVRINGLIAHLGDPVQPGDVVFLDDKQVILLEQKDLVTIAFHKPAGLVSTTDSAQPDSIMAYLNFPMRLFYMGRLDKASRGLMLLTNDGSLVNPLMRSRNLHEKEYLVTVDKPLQADFIAAMENGVNILDTRTRPAKLIPQSNHSFRLIISQGLNRQIRRMCEVLGYKVTDLLRLRIAHIELGDLAEGAWRELSTEEHTGLIKLRELHGSE